MFELYIIYIIYTYKYNHKCCFIEFSHIKFNWKRREQYVSKNPTSKSIPSESPSVISTGPHSTLWLETTIDGFPLFGAMICLFGVPMKAWDVPNKDSKCLLCRAETHITMEWRIPKQISWRLTKMWIHASATARSVFPLDRSLLTLSSSNIFFKHEHLKVFSAAPINIPCNHLHPFHLGQVKTASTAFGSWKSLVPIPLGFDRWGCFGNI